MKYFIIRQMKYLIVAGSVIVTMLCVIWATDDAAVTNQRSYRQSETNAVNYEEYIKDKARDEERRRKMLKRIIPAYIDIDAYEIISITRNSSVKKRKYGDWWINEQLTLVQKDMRTNTTAWVVSYRMKDADPVLLSIDSGLAVRLAAQDVQNVNVGALHYVAVVDEEPSATQAVLNAVILTNRNEFSVSGILLPEEIEECLRDNPSPFPPPILQITNPAPVVTNRSIVP
jgi:hypothetical protein